ncbi:MAG TPA: hypothetical protein VD969_12870 [Symbiobacteriaceae bacterium]|nr:hypothetical protein [Symbiobacteriaceae bacterium]
MAHVLHTDSHHDDEGERDWSGSDTGDCTGSDISRSDDSSGDASDCKRRRRRRHRCRHHLIPIGNISIDCTPVTFRTPGQAFNLVSCAVSQTLAVPVTRTAFVQEPTDFGCFICTPVTETVTVPVTATVNVPPTLVPIPRIVCPENVLCPQVCPTTVKVKSCGCH